MRALLLTGSVLCSLPALACENGMNEADQMKDRADALVARAGQQLDERDYRGAADSATQAINRSATRPASRRLARQLLAKARLKLGEFAEARSQFLKCLDEAAAPDDPVLLARVGEAEVGQGKLAEARARLEPLAAADLLPDGDARVALGRARAGLGDAVGAYAMVRSALEMEPGHPGALALKKQLDAAQGKKAGAPRS